MKLLNPLLASFTSSNLLQRWQYYKPTTIRKAFDIRPENSSTSTTKCSCCKPQMQVESIKVDEPVIISINNIVTKHQLSEIIKTINDSKEKQTLIQTTSYQENIFASDAFEKEDETLATIIQPFVQKNLIPSQYLSSSSKLESFVYVVTNFQNQLDESDIIKGANIIQRRQALERWKSDEGQKLMNLIESSHHQDFTIGQRYQLPMEIHTELMSYIPDIILGEWIIKDATIVTYDQGQTQVPHLDPCDATLIICLQECDKGGETCFPLVGENYKHKAGSGLLFFSSLFDEQGEEGEYEQSILSLHHGGQVEEGGKMIAQLMLEMKSKPESFSMISWLDALNLNSLDVSQLL